MGKILLEARGVSKKFCRRPEFGLRYAVADMWRELRVLPPRNDLREGEFWALRDIDLHVETGEVLGVIGHNGAGKSTLINLVAGMLLPTEGKIEVYTDRVALMDHQGGLNMFETGTENIANQLTVHGCETSDLEAEITAVSAFSELGEFIHAPVGTYSLGMRLRLAFSIYTRMRPDLFIVDEALGGGDLQFRQKFQKYIREYIDNGGSILLCSHEMYQIQTLCRRCILLDRGVKVTEGETVDVIHAYHELMMETERLASTKNVAMSAPANDHGDVEALSANEAQAESATSIAAVIPDTMVLENVCVRSQDGGSLRPGTAVEIEVSCLSPEDLTGVSCAIEIGRGDIFPITTLIGGSIDAPLNLQAGRSFLRCSIDRFTLAPGQFDLRAVISDIRSGAVLAQRGYDDAPFQFEVFTPADPLSNMMKYRQNLIFLPTIWQ